MTAARKIQPTKYTGPKAKRGDVIVIEHVLSYTKLHGKTVREKAYYFAYATKVARSGLVLEFAKANAPALSYAVDVLQRVMLITDPDRQAAARELILSHPWDFKDPDAIKTLIIDRVEGTR